MIQPGLGWIIEIMSHSEKEIVSKNVFPSWYQIRVWQRYKDFLDYQVSLLLQFEVDLGCHPTNRPFTFLVDTTTLLRHLSGRICKSRNWKMEWLHYSNTCSIHELFVHVTVRSLSIVCTKQWWMGRRCACVWGFVIAEFILHKGWLYVCTCVCTVVVLIR